jgi:hypothetical protein
MNAALARRMPEGMRPFLSYVASALRRAEEAFGRLTAVFEIRGDFPPSRRRCDLGLRVGGVA